MGAKWTKAEDEKVLAWLRQEKPTKEIVAALRRKMSGRTGAAIWARCYTLRVLYDLRGESRQ